jgi:hypothetical protein
MSLDSVLRYDSLGGARRKLQEMGATHLLGSVYGGYDGSSLPSRREAYLDGAFAAQLGEPPGGVHDEAETRAYVTGLCHAIWVEEHVGLPWSLRDYDPEAICLLLDRWVDTNGWTSDGQGTSPCSEPPSRGRLSQHAEPLPLTRSAPTPTLRAPVSGTLARVAPPN